MSRRGNCWADAVIERFFATLNVERGVTIFASHAAARSAVFDDIERCYNRKRRHSRLDDRTPLEAEMRWAARTRTGS